MNQEGAAPVRLCTIGRKAIRRWFCARDGSLVLHSWITRGGKGALPKTIIIMPNINAGSQERPPTDSWLKELKFYEKEIDSCERSLEELVANAGTPQKLMQIEHFQNQFILQRYNLRRLRRQLKWLARVPEEALYILIEEVRGFIRMFKSLLQEFDRFMAPYFHLPVQVVYNHPA